MAEGESFPVYPGDWQFDPDNLVKTVVAVPLLQKIERNPAEVQPVIIDVNVRFEQGRETAQANILRMIERAIVEAGNASNQGPNRSKTEASSQYVYARLQGQVIQKLVEMDQAQETRAIYHVWPDFAIYPHVEISSHS